MIKRVLNYFSLYGIVVLLILSSVDAGSQIVSRDNSSVEIQNTPIPQYSPLKDVLKDLEGKFDVNIIFQSRLVKDLGVKIDYKQEKEIDEILKKLLEPHGLTFSKVGGKDYIIKSKKQELKKIKRVSKKIIPTDTQSRLQDSALETIDKLQKKFSDDRKRLQDRQISGKVLDEEGLALPGVNILIKGTTVGTVTDIDGNYNLTVPNDNATIVFSFVGYLTEEVTVGNRTVINLTMSPDITTLGEVVVVAYGESRKAELIGSVATVGAETLDKLPITTFEEGLAGQVAGLSVRQNTSRPGGAPEILVRGIGSISAGNAPLFVVDGFIFGNTNDQLNNPLAFLSPNDIESISVLKDAASSALYGSRASNGVVLITTKSGRKGKTVINFDSYAGVQTVVDRVKPDVLNARELAQFNQEKFEDAFFDQNGVFPTEQQIRDAGLPNPASFLEGTDWFDELTQSAPLQSYQISAQGGNQDVNYFMSMSYFDQEGVVVNTGFQRYSLRTNVDAKLADKFKAGIRLNTVRLENERNGGTDPAAGGFQVNGTVFTSFWLAPDVPVRDRRGNLIEDTEGRSVLTSTFQNNPVYEQQVKLNELISNQIITTAYLEYEPIENLKIKPSFGVNIIQNRIARSQPRLLDAGAQIFPGEVEPQAGINNTENFRWQSENILTYQRTINEDHNLNFLGAFTIQKVSIRGANFTATNLIDPAFPFVNSGNVRNTALDDINTPAFNLNGNESLSEQSLISYLGQLKYNYKDKYLLTASIRRDGSSRFGSDVRYANFPSVGIGWRASEEQFFKNLGVDNILSNVFFEASYGEVGNNRIGDFAWRGGVGGANYVLDGGQAVGRSVNRLANPQLTWEQTEEFSVGMDVGFLDNRVILEVDAYKRNTTQLINNLALPRITGFGSILGNIGELENRGLEILVKSVNIDNNKFRWTTDLNITIDRNEIIKLGESDRPIFLENAANGAPYSIVQVGRSIGEFYGLQFLGLYTQEDLDNPDVPTYQEGSPAVGSARFLDADGDGLIERGIDDLVLIGDANPDFSYGITNNLTYGPLSLKVIMAGVVGQQIIDMTREVTHNFDGNTSSLFNVSSEVKNRWRPGDDLATATFPGTAGNDQQWRWPHSEFIQDAGYLSVRNITLTFDFQDQFARQLPFLTDGSIYVSVQNAFIFSPFDGNPEIGKAASSVLLRNVNYGSYPLARTITGGIRLTF
ncbi:MAG: SusC/RagA family TonB-linked outer membrane protein [Bacteroidota bacterium]